MLIKVDQGPCLEAEDALARNISWISADLALAPLDREIVELLGRYIQLSKIENLFDILSPNMRMVTNALAFLLAEPRAEIQKRLRPEAPLIRSGLIRVSSGSRYLTSTDESDNEYLTLATVIRRTLPVPFGSQQELRAAIFGPPLKAELDFERFSALGAERDLAARVLGGALSRRAGGVNILLHGPPGSGKTAFCKALAARLDADLFAVGEADQDDQGLDWQERLAALRFMQQLARHRSGCLLLFDEMEDIRLSAKQKANRGVSKVYFNRLLETNPVPVLWTSNDIWDVDPAYLRRMTLIVEFKVPNAGERRRIWQNVLAESALSERPEALHGLVERYEVTPAVAANAVRAAELANGNLEDVDLALRGVHGALNGGRAPPSTPGRRSGFDLELVNADCDLKALVSRLKGCARSPAVSLCLYGPPGSGKSEFALHLARELGLKPLKKRGSDLISKWVGESEQNIARAFEQAVAEQAVLIFDEADALLADRTGAQHSWEISQVAEMLTWMEAHPLPFCCTTNLFERLDQAALRRFLFKVRFDYLDRGRIALAFERFFGRPVPGEALVLGALTPSDFATVRHKAELLGLNGDTGALVDLLAAESRAKPDRPLPIGFNAA